MRILCFLLLLVGNVVFAQNAKIDSLKKVIATTKVDTVKGRSLCRLCAELSIYGEWNDALAKGREGLAIAEKSRDERGIVKCLFHTGQAYYNLNQTYQALRHFQRGFLLSKQIRSLIMEAGFANELANAFMYQTNYPKALEYFLITLNLSHQLKHQIGIAGSKMNIGLVYHKMANDSLSLLYYRQSLSQFEQLQYKDGIATCWMNMGNVYVDQCRYTESIDAYQKSIKVYEQLDDFEGISSNLMNIGLSYFYQKKYNEAFTYYQKSLRVKEEIKEELKDSNGVGLLYINIGLAQSRLGRYNVAKDYFNKGLSIAQKLENIQTLKSGYEFSYQADSALGDWKSAFEHHKLYKQYSDSLHNEGKAKEFGRIESRYQFEQEAEAQKRKKQEAQRIAQIETERRNNLQYLSIFAGLMILFGGLAFIGKLKIPRRVLDIALFAALLILFEFLLILFDPILDRYTGGIPIQKLIFNSVIALGFAPLHGFLEKRLRKRFTT